MADQHILTAEKIAELDRSYEAVMAGEEETYPWEVVLEELRALTIQSPNAKDTK